MSIIKSKLRIKTGVREESLSQEPDVFRWKNLVLKQLVNEIYKIIRDGPKHVIDWQ
jgi:hypothetical protein